MSGVVFIGDELTASGYRLAGVATRVVEPGEVPESLSRALDEAVLVLITADAAAELPPGELEGLVRGAQPPVAVVESAASKTPPPDLEAEVRGALGMGP